MTIVYGLSGFLISVARSHDRTRRSGVTKAHIDRSITLSSARTELPVASLSGFPCVNRRDVRRVVVNGLTACNHPTDHCVERHDVTPRHGRVRVASGIIA